MNKVLLGVRPEHMTACSEDETNCIKGTILVNEMMGSELHLHVKTGAEKNTILRLPTVDLSPAERAKLVAGNKLSFTFASKVVQLFDPETEKSRLYKEANKKDSNCCLTIKESGQIVHSLFIYTFSIACLTFSAMARIFSLFTLQIARSYVYRPLISSSTSDTCV